MTSSMTLNILGESHFNQVIRDASGNPLTGASIDTVQVNIGLRCNLACRHCHVESSPKREEQMTWDTMQAVLAAAKAGGAQTLDITGGAPEMHPDFCRFVDRAIAQQLKVMVRTNLTIMLEDGYADLPSWYAQRGVHLVASLPCYLPVNVDRQRGRHVYRGSIDVIKQLNAVGYGHDQGPVLDLVYNPGGPALPPAQKELEQAYRLALFDEHDIRFNHLFTITNVPIGRFLHDLAREGKADEYLQLLRDSFNPQTIDGLMCRHQLHVGWDGTMFDCDFNYALGLPAETDAQHVRDFEPRQYIARKIVTGDHCFACTAGAGSSCTGALT